MTSDEFKRWSCEAFHLSEEKFDALFELVRCDCGNPMHYHWLCLSPKDLHHKEEE